MRSGSYWHYYYISVHYLTKKEEISPKFKQKHTSVIKEWIVNLENLQGLIIEPFIFTGRTFTVYHCSTVHYCTERTHEALGYTNTIFPTEPTR